jgi:hypothetical protein
MDWLSDLWNQVFSTGRRAGKIDSRSAKRNKQVVHIFEFLAPTNKRRSDPGKLSAYKEHKPVHAPRHISHR